MRLAKKVALKELVAEFAQRNKNDEPIPVYSVTNSAGFCADYFSKDVFSQNLKTYKIVPRGCFAYNPSRINVGSVDCQEVEERVIVSPLYVVFSVVERLNRRFLRYFLKSPMGLTQIKAFSVGSVRDCLKFSALQKIEIPLPTLAEQERIAAELDAVAATLKKRQAQLSELDALVESRFVELFDGGRFPTVAIGDEFKTTSGGTPSCKMREYYDGGSIPWLNSGEVNRGIVDFAENFITELGLKNSSAKWVPVDSVLVAMYGATVGKVGLLQIPATTNQAVCSILPNSQFCPRYVYFAVKSQERWMRLQALGGAQPNISQTVIKKMTIPKPPLELQERFAAEVARVEAIKAKVRDGIAETQTLFDALTQKYFG